MSDILINLNTAYFYQGLIVMDHVKIITNYLKSNFFLDLITFTIYLYFMVFESILSGLLFLFFFKLPTLKILYNRILDKFKIRLRIHSSIIDLVNLFFFSFLILHLFACVWHFTGLYSIKYDNRSWIVKYEILDRSITVRYLYSLYWSSVTIMTVGYGDMVGQNDLEIFFCTITCFFGCGVFAYVINAVGQIVDDINSESILYK